jgi:hypothetical protein
MHKGNTRVHGVIYLCSKPHNLHCDHDIMNLVLWWAWQNTKDFIWAHLSWSSSWRRYHKLVLDLSWKFIASSCCHFEIPTEDIFLDMPDWKIIHQYQLKYDLHNFDTNWRNLQKLMPIGMNAHISYCHLGNAHNTRDSIKLHKLEFHN